MTTACLPGHKGLHYSWGTGPVWPSHWHRH